LWQRDNIKEVVMKKTVINIVALFLISAVTGMLAIADTMTERVTFAHPVTVNGTLIKDGVYKLQFDDQTGMLTFKRNGDIVATAPARLEKVDKHSQAEYSTRTDGDASILTSVKMDDGYRAILLNGVGGGDR
jgi:hypothetical protein